MADRGIRKLWVLVAALIAIIISIVAGLLKWQMDHSVPGAILYAGGAFIITLPLNLLVLRELGAFDFTAK